MNLLYLGCCLLIFSIQGCATTDSAHSRQANDGILDGLNARTNVALLLAQAATAEAEPTLAVKRLESAWKLSSQLIDDRIVRAAISDSSAHHTSPTLTRVANVAKAQDAFADNAAEKVRQLLAKEHAGYDLTEARRLLLLALVQVANDPAGAKLLLARVANGGLQSASGLELQNMARTTAASIDFEEQNLSKAIKTYLRVSEESAYWPTARTAISWAQFQLKKYDRAIAGLRLLPGGIGAAPDRALLAAVCFHHLGQVKAAREIIAVAQGNIKTWVETEASAMAVLAVIRDETSAPGLMTSVAWHPPIRLLGRELNATDALSSSVAPSQRAALDAYRAQAWQKFEAMVTRKSQTAREAAKIAYEKLTILAPQLK